MATVTPIARVLFRRVAENPVKGLRYVAVEDQVLRFICFLKSKFLSLTLIFFDVFLAPFFTRDPAQLRGERIRTQLVKSMQGLGFTIVGGDDNVEEFLQIKSVVPNGPAWLDAKLKTGNLILNPFFTWIF